MISKKHCIRIHLKSYRKSINKCDSKVTEKHNEIQFSLRDTGALAYNARAQSFPLNILTGGNYYHSSRVLCVALFAICLVVFLILIKEDLVK